MRRLRRRVRPSRIGKCNLARRAVTLVEMLVVVALTVLLMSIVAEVFVLASATLGTLQSVSDLNQTTRSVEPIIREDLKNRTIRIVQPPVERRDSWFAGPNGVPGGPGDDDGINGTNDPGEFGWPGSDDVRVQVVVPVGFDPADGQGYLMIEENSPADEQGEDVDDVIAFTVRLTEASRALMAGTVEPAYYGRANIGSEPDQAFFPLNDELAGSQEAEIVYFLRRGTLYRRVLLVGVPQPTILGPGSWYAQFDVSARPSLTQGAVPTVNSLGDLSYRSTRYGHRPPLAYTSGVPNAIPPLLPGLGNDFPGDPLFQASAYAAHALEFQETVFDWQHAVVDHNQNYPGIQMPVGELWFGRPTLRESSSPNFDHPNWPAGPAPRPTNPLSTLWANPWNQVGPGVVPPEFWDSTSPRYYQTLDAMATRIAEDVLLTNVLSFDIKVFDPDATSVPAAAYPGTPPSGAFVDIGRFSNPVATDPSYVMPGPYPSSGSPFGPPSVNMSALLAGMLAYPKPATWPPERPFFTVPNWKLEAEPAIGPRIGGYRRGFAEPYGSRLPDAAGLLNNSTNNPGFSQYVIPPGLFSTLPDGMLRAPVALARTYDTWCTAYTQPTVDYIDANNNGVRDAGEAVVPVAPPYIVPIRGIQIKIRFVDPDTRLTREITIVQELQ